jgi:hypothetical protein
LLIFLFYGGRRPKAPKEQALKEQALKEQVPQEVLILLQAFLLPQ